VVLNKKLIIYNRCVADSDQTMWIEHQRFIGLLIVLLLHADNAEGHGKLRLLCYNIVLSAG